MPRETRFFKCEACGKQYDSWGGAEMCEGEHEMVITDE